MLTDIKVLFADADELRRDGMAALLQSAGGFDVVAQYPDGGAALEGLRALNPELAIVDLNLAGLSGIEFVRRVRSEGLRAKIIVISGVDDAGIVREVVRAGADGYLLKDSPARHLLDAIRYVRDGGQYFSPHLRRDYGQNGTGARQSRDGFDDRGREILSKMAEGIRPLLHHIEAVEDEIEGRIHGEAGHVPSPRDSEAWFSLQLAATARSTGRGVGATQPDYSVRDLEIRLPKLIEETVSKRFHAMANNLHRKMEESQVNSIETFGKNIQMKLIHRVSLLENEMAVQADQMNQLRESSQRTEGNLSRLIGGVDQLVQELPERLNRPAVCSSVSVKLGKVEKRSRSRAPRPKNRLLRVVGFFILLCSIGAGTCFLAKRAQTPNFKMEEFARLSLPATSADTKTKMDAAEEFTRRKDYPTAEGLYRQVIVSNPKNVDALKGLASVLYRQDKIDDSTAVLSRIPLP